MAPAEAIADAIRDGLRLRLRKNATLQAVEGLPIRLSGGEADEAARLALAALAEHGLVVVARADLDAYVNRDGMNLLREVDGLNALLAVLAASEPR